MLASRTCRTCLPRNGSGIAAAGGDPTMPTDEVSVSCAAAVSSPNAASTASASAASKCSPPPYTTGTGTSRIVIAVTTPAGTRPPRNAQNRSGSVSAVTWRSRPSAVTTSNAVTWSAA